MVVDRQGTRPEPGRAQSVRRALAILEAVGTSYRDVGIVELSQRVGLPVSTVHRLLATLVDDGFVVQNAETGRYRVGIRAFELGNAFLKQTQLSEIAMPGMRDLCARVNETVNLAIRDAYSAVYVDQVESDHLLKLFTRKGTRVALYCTGVGKVFLAGFSQDEIDAYLSTTELTPRTPKTVTDPALLRQQLEQLRSQGYAVDDEEFEWGVRCVAAPIHDHRGETIAALSVSGPAQRITNKVLAALSKELSRSSNAISAQMGGTLEPLAEYSVQ